MEKTVTPIKELKFYDVVINMELCDLERMREILLDKKATRDNIKKLETLNSVILSKKKNYEYIERSLDE